MRKGVLPWSMHTEGLLLAISCPNLEGSVAAVGFVWERKRNLKKSRRSFLCGRSWRDGWGSCWIHLNLVGQLVPQVHLLSRLDKLDFKQNMCSVYTSTDIQSIYQGSKVEYTGSITDAKWSVPRHPPDINLSRQSISRLPPISSPRHSNNTQPTTPSSPS